MVPGKGGVQGRWEGGKGTLNGDSQRGGQEAEVSWVVGGEGREEDSTSCPYLQFSLPNGAQSIGID